MGFSYDFWFSAVLLIIVLVWQQYNGESAAGKIISGVLRVIGVAALVWFYFYYQSPQAAEPIFGTQLRPSWWGILGLIGRAYLIAALIYLAIGRRPELLMFAALLVSMAHVVSFGGGLREWWYLDGGDRLMITAGQGSVVLLGAVAGAKILQLRGMEAGARHREFLLFLGWFALIAFAVAVVLRKLYGLHKDSTFPAYVYASVAWTVLAWWLIYWLCDVRKIDNPVTRFFNRVGGIALSAYVMSSLLRCLASLVPVSGGKTLFYWLFASLAPWLEKLGVPLWFVQIAGAGQTIFFALVVCGVCLWFKNRKMLLKI